MDNIASLKLCKTLHELSGWEDTNNFYHDDGSIVRATGQFARTPVYDLGYLWRKLPPSIKVELAKRVHYEDTPEDAACELLCKLIRQGDIKL